MRTTISSTRLTTLTVMLFCIGCGDQLPLYPVAGQVTGPDGQALAKARVTFECDDPPVSAAATTDDRGAFELGTYEAADGAPAGNFRVAVAEWRGDDADHPLPPTISAKYTHFDTSGLTFEVEPGDNECRLQLLERP